MTLMKRKIFIKSLIKTAAIILMVPAVSAIVLLILATVNEYRPAEREVVFSADVSGLEPDAVPDTLSILTWNIGYCGLGDNMDFFYDGGKRMRDTESRTRENLSAVISRLKDIDADIMLLQEVDRNSYRSYGIDQVYALQCAFPEYHVFYAPNYVSDFVPIPVMEPMRRVNGGLVILSRYRPLEVTRHQYPSSFPYPVRLFNLKRCLLSAEFITRSGERLFVGNTHNTAYDTGGMRTQECVFLGAMLDSLASAGTPAVVGGDWNQYPASYVPSGRELTNEFFVPEKLDEEVLCGDSGRIVYDGSSFTLRYLDHPLDSASVRTVTDFFYVSDSISVNGIKAIATGFRNTDHEPVLMTLHIRDKSLYLDKSRK